MRSPRAPRTTAGAGCRTFALVALGLPTGEATYKRTSAPRNSHSGGLPPRPRTPGPKTTRPGFAPVCTPSRKHRHPVHEELAHPDRQLVRLLVGRTVDDRRRVEQHDIGVHPLV